MADTINDAHEAPQCPEADGVDKFAANLESLARKETDPLRKGALIWAAGLGREYAKRTRALS